MSRRRTREHPSVVWTSELVVELVRRLPAGSVGRSLTTRIRKFVGLSSKAQEAGLVEIVLDIEDQILAQPEVRLDRDRLRARVYQPFRHFLADPRFIPLDVSPRQRIRLFSHFLEQLVDDTPLVSASLNEVLPAIKNWLQPVGDGAEQTIRVNESAELPTDEAGWLNALLLMAAGILDDLRVKLGEEEAQERVLKALSGFPAPAKALDAYRAVRDMLPRWVTGDRSGRAPFTRTETSGPARPAEEGLEAPTMLEIADSLPDMAELDTEPLARFCAHDTPVIETAAQLWLKEVPEATEYYDRISQKRAPVAKADAVGAVGPVSRRSRSYEQDPSVFVKALLATGDPVWDWDLDRDRMYFSDEWMAVLGCSPEELGEAPDGWLKHVHPDDLDRLNGDFASHLCNLTPRFENEHRIRDGSGSYRWVLARGKAIRNDEGRVTRLVGALIDLTDRKVNDLLTGLPNRGFLMERLGHVFDEAQNDSAFAYAVLFVDLDHFKMLNDSLGHHVGDQLILALARRLQTCVQEEDTVVRVGGDEFVVLLGRVDRSADAARIADRIHQELRAPFYLGRHEVFASVSIGIALSSMGYTSPEELIRDADLAMYRAKAEGRARYEIFDVQMRQEAESRQKLYNDLLRAVERERFELYFQPIASVGSNEVVGFEALIRWLDTGRGLVPPEVFIPLAEETGLIVPIGRWVLNEACRHLREWSLKLETKPLWLSVNLSPRQFSRGELEQQLEEVIGRSGVDPERLKLEITESMIVHDHEYAGAVLGRLRDLGVQLCVDDFGTGYSSLAHLHRLPIDVLKVDRSFVSRMREDGTDCQIVETIIALAHNLGMKVVAEGVETAFQKTHLESLGCDFYQGYLLAKPMAAEKVHRFVAVGPKAG